MLIAKRAAQRIDKGPNIQSLPLFEALQYARSSILLKWRWYFYWWYSKSRSWSITITLQYSEISKYSYYAIDPTFYDRAIENQKEHEGYCVIAGDNFAGQVGEHAALAPKYLGQKFAIAKSYARIGWQNLINWHCSFWV
jgi:aconitate hydratase